MEKNTIQKFLNNKSKMSKLRRTITCLAAVVVFATTYALILPAMTLDGSDAQKTPGIDTKTEINIEKFGQSLGADKDSGSDVAENAAQTVSSEEKDVSGGEGAAKQSVKSEGNGEKATEAALNSEGAKANGSDSKVGSDNEAKDGVKKAPSGSKDSKTADDNKVKNGDSKDISLITEKTEIKYDGKGYKVIAEVGADAKLPADTKLNVREIKKETKDEDGVKYAYDTYCDEALKAVRDKDGEDGKNLERQVKLYNISFVSESADAGKIKGVSKAANGNIEPAAPVKITVEYDEAIKYRDKNVIRAVHFDDTDMDKDKAAEAMIDKDKLHDVKKVVLETKSENNDADSMKDVQFKSDRFSIYGLVYTIKAEDEEKAEEQKAAADNENVLTASDDNYEITVTYDDKAGIPEGAELKVKEITEKDEEYAGLQEDIANNLDDKELTIPKKPALFDISIWADGQEIEPAKGSKVNVEVKLASDVMDGMFTGEDAPLLVNDDPIDEEMSDLDNSIQVIHQVEEGKLEVMETEDTISDEEVVSEFATESFSDWLLFYDETVENITIGVNDSLTLRPYSKWVWKRNAEEEQYQNYKWQVPTSSIISFKKDSKTDDQLNETYEYYHGKASGTGEFDLQLKDGDTVVHTIHVTVVGDVPDLPNTVQGSNDIKINLFDYDLNTTDRSKSGSLDVQSNVASSTDNSSVNKHSDLKFLGYGGSNTNSEWFSINNYTKDVPSQGIVQNRLVGGFPQLGKSTTGKERGKPSLAYLFNTDSRNNDVYAYPNVSGLFQKDGGYYYYNSNSNYAYLDPKNTSQITLYEHTYSQWTEGSAGPNAKPIGFFPFHRYDSYLKEGNTGMNFNTNLNHHFGMSMTVDFEIPSDGLDEYGEPITFEFSGDDDMWVFIDNNLVLDVGGIHQPVTGKINFSSDKVEVYGVPDTTITQRFKDANSPTPWAIGDGKPHTMKIFYLERGGCDSNLSVKFNTPTRFGKGKLSVFKSKSDNKTAIKGAEFKIWNNAECEGEPIGTVTSDENGNANFGEFVIKSATDTFYMQETKAPEGYIRDTSIYQVRPRVDGSGAVVKDSNGYVILDVYKNGNGTALEKLSNDAVIFPNTEIGKINIPVKKNWVGNPTEGASVNLTIKRYKLIDKTKGFVIEQKLIGEPEGYTDFAAKYEITYPDGNTRTVDYSEFQNGRYSLTDAEPGKYTIVETVTGTNPDGYNMTHSTQVQEVTLEEDGTAKVDYQTTFVKQSGVLRIKADVEVQNGSASDIDYSRVRYAVLDSTGKKVTSVTHEQAVNGVNLTLPVGAYMVKAVSIPKTPTNLRLAEQKVNDTDGTISATLNVVEEKPVQASFYIKYAKQNNAQNCTWKIKDQFSDQAHNWQELVYKSGKVEYPVGTKVRMSFKVPQGRSALDTVNYDGKTLTGSGSPTADGMYEYSVEFVVKENAVLSFSINVYNNKNIDITGPRFEVVGSATNSILKSLNRTAAYTPKRAASNSGTLSTQNTATHPVAPEGKKYVKDTDWSSTVTLDATKNWNDTLRDLPSTDDEGNKYYYYVAEVNETGLDDSTVCSIDLAGENQLLIGEDLNNDNEKALSVTNTQTGALQIVKNVQFNGDTPKTEAQKKALAGTYTFKIYKDQNCSPDQAVKENGEDKVLTVTIGEDGVSKESEIVTLPVGTYWIKEIVGADSLVLPVGENPKQVTVSSGNTASHPVKADVTNNCEFNESDDDMTIDIVKTFNGLSNSSEIPAGYKAVLSYKLKDGTQQNIDLGGSPYQTENGVHVKVSKTQDGLQWTWHVYRIPKDSTGFTVHEVNYTNPDYKLSVTINGESVENPEAPKALDIQTPEATFEPVAKEKITAESKLKRFYVSNDYILLVSVNPHGTVVLSDSSLNYQERAAIKNAIESGSITGSFSTPVRFFSTEQHQNTIKLDSKRTITVSKTNDERYVVELPPNTNSQVVGYTVKYDQEEVVNNAEIVNEYIGKEVPVEIIKVDKDTMGEKNMTKLKGAHFTITQLDEKSAGGYKQNADSADSQNKLFYQDTLVTDDQGIAVSGKLKKGFYEIEETKAPSGYVLTAEKFYIKVQNGTVTRIKKVAGSAVENWPEETDNSGLIRFNPSSGEEVITNASFTVGNEKGAALPSAGGPGTTWIYLLGALLTLGAGMSLVVRRRMSV